MASVPMPRPREDLTKEDYAARRAACRKSEEQLRFALRAATGVQFRTTTS